MRIRSIFSLACLLYSFYSNAQDNNNIFGLTYQPFIYENYNKSDWNNRPDSYPITTNNFNGKAFGIVIQKPITDLFSIRVEALYSIQNQQHSILSVMGSDPNTHMPKNYYGTDVKTEFNIFKLPIQLSITKELVPGSQAYIQAFLGPQISYLNSFSSIYTQYAFNYTINQIDYNFLLNKVIRTPKYFEQTIWQYTPNPGYENYNGQDKMLYNRFLFGIIGGIEFQKKISDIFILGLGGRYEYDFTNSEKYPNHTYPGLGGVKDGTRSKSHNLRYGLSFTTMYIFN